MTLFHRFIDPPNFGQAWDQVATNQGCAGVDGETVADFGRRKAHALETLRQQVIAGTYRPLPLRQIIIPKPKGGWRELGVQAMTILNNADLALTLEQVRGYEGTGAAQYFQCFKPLITNPGFDWQGRNFHPPTDPVNSLLSFGYTLLFNNVFSLLMAEGLNPYLGHLHGAERQKAYLAFDLMEEFRSPIVDALVMRLVNQKIIRPTDFTWPKENNGVYLTGPARRVFLKHFEQRITETLSHPDVKEAVTYRRVIHLQVQRYKRAIMGNAAYESFQRIR